MSFDYLPKRFLGSVIFTTALITALPLWAVDISNPLNLMFAADSVDNIIDVIDLQEEAVVFRIETKYQVDDVIATPYAPVLVFTNIERKLVSVYDLRTQEVAREIELPIAPRHMVLDTTGTKIGFSDSKDGGFVLFSPYAAAIMFTLEDFPATTDVLFSPNDIDIYYSNGQAGTIGLIDTNTQRTFEIEVTDTANQILSSPSRSLDGRYVYVANQSSGEIYSLNVFSKTLYRTFAIGESPARPYTTPEGRFLYMMDEASGRFVSTEQNGFGEYEDIVIGEGINLVTVGRFDRMNLFASSNNKNFYIYDNLSKSVIESGQFRHMPLDTQGSLDGHTTYVAFSDSPEIAIIDLEDYQIRYISAGNNGIGAFGIGLSNNVCH
jgi:DNA-binding beta-propeller fold protein YncE|tara:strand:- start:16687 stop:17823 length:1137 start_codon:yes stop_codon:yes gene_type:complete